MKAKTIKLFKENIVAYLYDLRFGKGLLDMTTKTQKTLKN